MYACKCLNVCARKRARLCERTQVRASTQRDQRTPQAAMRAHARAHRCTMRRHKHSIGNLYQDFLPLLEFRVSSTSQRAHRRVGSMTAWVAAATRSAATLVTTRATVARPQQRPPRAHTRTHTRAHARARARTHTHTHLRAHARDSDSRLGYPRVLACAINARRPPD